MGTLMHVKMSSFSHKLSIRIASIYESAFSIGDPVWVHVDGTRLAGHVRAVTFTTGKVRYAIKVGASVDVDTTFHNLDSMVVEPRPDGERVEFGFDNYS